MIELIDFFPDKLFSLWVFALFILYFIVDMSFNPLYLFNFIIFFYYSFVIILLIKGDYFFAFLASFAGLLSKITPAYILYKESVNFFRDIKISLIVLLLYLLWLSVNNTNVLNVYGSIIYRINNIPFTIENIPKILLLIVGIEINY
jgi:hypothetical protein